MSRKSVEMFDFLFEREDCKLAEDSLRSTLFSSHESNSFQASSIKQEMYGDDISLEWKADEAASDFCVDELLGSCFADEVLNSGSQSLGNVRQTTSSKSLGLKEEDFEPFKDFVSLPFDAVMDPFETGFEVASDSGISTDNVAEILLSPSSGATTPDRMGDISVDMDAVSDVSSTSDLGSMGSVGSSPNRRHEHPAIPIRFEFGPSQSLSFDDDVEMKSLPAHLNTATSKSSSFFISSPSALGQRTVVAAPHTVTKLSSPSMTNVTNSPQHSTIATRSIKLELSHPQKIAKPYEIVPHSTGSSATITTRSPVFTKVRLDSSGSIISTARTTSTAPSTTANKLTSPQTIVVTQAGKSNPLLRNGTLLKAGTGRSILLPVNVSDLNQVKTIKIISASSNNSSNRNVGVTGIRTLVSTVRPVSTSANSVGGEGSRATFYTTSKGSDGRSILKVTPTAFVTPTTATTNHHSEISRVSLTPSYSRDEDLSDDETPQPNQELVLNEEERKLMRKEGLVLPARYPLTKQEERDLKRIRRKIRNKISAQDSRKRKKEYVDGLEDRVKNSTEENQQLQKRIRTLEKQNECLLAQLKKIQNLDRNGFHHSRQHNHTSSVLMMIILSAALIVVPSLRSQDGKGENELTREGKMPPAGHTRNLLEVKNSALNLEGFHSESDNDEDDVEFDSLDFSHALSDHDYAPVAKKPCLDTPSAHFFSPPSVDKTYSRENGDPPDRGGLNVVAAMIGAMLDRLGSNWTDSGGSLLGNALNRTPHRAPERPSSVVVDLNHGRRLRDDIELE